MGQASRTFGTSYPIAHNGTTYTVSPITLDMLGMFEVWLESRAWEKVERIRTQCAPADYQARLDSVTRMVCADEFAFGSGTFAKASTTPEGERYLFYLALRAGQQDITEAKAAEIWEADQERIRARQEAGNVDPNRPAPEPTPG